MRGKTRKYLYTILEQDTRKPVAIDNSANTWSWFCVSILWIENSIQEILCPHV